MLKSLLNYTALVGLFRAYKGKIYLVFSMVVVYFLIEHVYADIQAYLAKNNKDYLLVALWIKSLLLVLLGALLLVAFRPRKKNVVAAKHEVTIPKKAYNRNDEEIIERVRGNSHLIGGDPLDLTSGSDGKPHKNHAAADDEEIIEKIRNKKKLESRADKVIKEINN